MAANYHELRRLYKEKRAYNLRKQHDAGIVLGLTILICLLMALWATLGHTDSLTIVDMSKIIQIESSWHPDAYNRHTGATGLCQITPIVLKEYNKMQRQDYSKRELFDKDINIKIGDWYMNHRIPQMLKHYHIKDTLRNRLWAYNAGIGQVVSNIMPQETKDYIVKYEE